MSSSATGGKLTYRGGSKANAKDIDNDQALVGRLIDSVRSEQMQHDAKQHSSSPSSSSSSVPASPSSSSTSTPTSTSSKKSKKSQLGSKSASTSDHYAAESIASHKNNKNHSNAASLNSNVSFLLNRSVRFFSLALFTCLALFVFVLLIELQFPNSVITKTLLHPPKASLPCGGVPPDMGSMSTLCGYNNPVDVKLLKLSNGQALILASSHEHRFFNLQDNDPYYGIHASLGGGPTKLIWPPESPSFYYSKYSFGTLQTVPTSKNFRPSTMSIKFVPGDAMLWRGVPASEVAPMPENFHLLAVLNQAPSRYAIEFFEIRGLEVGVGAMEGVSETGETVPISPGGTINGVYLLWVGGVSVPFQMGVYGMDLFDMATAMRHNSKTAAIAVSSDFTGHPTTFTTIYSKLNAVFGMNPGKIRIWLPSYREDLESERAHQKVLNKDSPFINDPIILPRWSGLDMGAPVPKHAASIVTVNGQLVYSSSSHVCRANFLNESLIISATLLPPHANLLTKDVHCVDFAGALIESLSLIHDDLVLIVERPHTLKLEMLKLKCALGRTPCDSPWNLHVLHIPTMQGFKIFSHDGSLIGAVTSAAYMEGVFFMASQYGERLGVLRATKEQIEFMKNLLLKEEKRREEMRAADKKLEDERQAELERKNNEAGVDGKKLDGKKLEVKNPERLKPEINKQEHIVPDVKPAIVKPVDDAPVV